MLAPSTEDRVLTYYGPHHKWFAHVIIHSNFTNKLPINMRKKSNYIVKKYSAIVNVFR